MGRKSLGEVKLTNAEKQKRYRLKKEQRIGKEEAKKEERSRKKLKLIRLKNDPAKYKAHLARDAARKRKLSSPMKVNIGQFSTLRRSLNRTKKAFHTNLLKKEWLRKHCLKKLLMQPQEKRD